MDNISIMMELELLKRGLDNSYYIACRRIDALLEELKEQLKEDSADGE